MRSSKTNLRKICLEEACIEQNILPTFLNFREIKVKKSFKSVTPHPYLSKVKDR